MVVDIEKGEMASTPNGYRLRWQRHFAALLAADAISHGDQFRLGSEGQQHAF